MSSSQLANVSDVFNAILVRGDAIGDVVFYGRGAGKLPTASAVVADVIDCAKHTNRKKIFGWGPSEDGYVENYEELDTALFVRAMAADVEKAKEAVKSVFPTVKFVSRDNQPADEFAFVTDTEKEKDLVAKLNSINEIKPCSVIRVSDY